MKPKTAKTFAKILSCILSAAIFCTIGAAAAETYDSGAASHGIVGETSYQFHSTLYRDNGAQWRAATWMQVADGKSAPAGFMKAKAFLYDATGNLCRSTTMQANTASAKFLFVVTPAVKGDGEYISRGWISQYSPDGGYQVMSADQATRSKTDIMKVLEADLDEHGAIPSTLWARPMAPCSCLMDTATGRT